MAGCSGHTTSATNITTTSATLNGVATCASGEQCNLYFQYRRAGDTDYTGLTPTAAANGPINNAAVAQPAPGSNPPLTPNTEYQYELCGRPSQHQSYACVGPDDATGTYSTFHTGWASAFSGASWADTGWSYWGQDEAIPDWGHISLINPATDGVPQLNGNGGQVGKFEVTGSDLAAGKIHAKLYNGFYGNTNQCAPPADVSGTYSAWYYLPPNYQVPDGDKFEFFEFKELRPEPGKPCHGRSDDSYFMRTTTMANCRQAAQEAGTTPPGDPNHPNDPCIWALYPGESSPFQGQHFMALPRGRWFQISAGVSQGKAISFFVDGHLLDIFTPANWPVGNKYDDRTNWTFGVGDYQTDGTVANGPIYVDNASYQPW